MSLWIDKYKPCGFSRLDYHLEQAEQLHNLVSYNNIFYFNELIQYYMMFLTLYLILSI